MYRLRSHAFDLHIVFKFEPLKMSSPNTMSNKFLGLDISATLSWTAGVVMLTSSLPPLAPISHPLWQASTLNKGSFFKASSQPLKKELKYQYSFMIRDVSISIWNVVMAYCDCTSPWFCQCQLRHHYLYYRSPMRNILYNLQSKPLIPKKRMSLK